MSPRMACADDQQLAAPVIDILRACAQHVFQTMLGTSLVERTALAGDALRPAGNVVGMIGFGGSRSGLVVFYATFEAACRIRTALLGVDPGVAPSRLDAADAIGEITNMIAGAFRTRMATAGDAWAISIPTVTMGSDFYITPLTDGRRTLLPFRMDDHEIFVELVMSTRARSA